MLPKKHEKRSPSTGFVKALKAPQEQGVRAFGLRRSRYRGTEKTRLQHLATAAAINPRAASLDVRRPAAGKDAYLPFCSAGGSLK